jgi:hypothetical protein
MEIPRPDGNRCQFDTAFVSLLIVELTGAIEICLVRDWVTQNGEPAPDLVPVREFGEGETCGAECSRVFDLRLLA